MKTARLIQSIFASLLILLSCSGPESQSTQSVTKIDELQQRINMAADRIIRGKEPAITEDFLLAGLTLDPQFKRRFTNYSGDQSGRYLSVFSRFEVEGNPVDIHRLVKKIITTQKNDGRFGSEVLDFKVGALQGEHMALLWGNGRLLNGLLDYYQAYQDAAVLESAIKLGDFLISITENCIVPGIIEEFKKKGAMGFICFTQNIEGLVKLFQATNNRDYLELAQKIYPLLPEMGTQHSHGYLNTLRGILMLYTVTQQPAQLEFVTTRYKEILASENYLVSGGVPEFFGSSGSEDGYRDEGCSEADWLMLSLELWQSTGEIHYLDKAEYCLVNAMMFNQFNSGDFGHHHIDPGFGYILSKCEGRAWWCCNYHGLQALLQARDLITTNDNGVRKINMFYNTSYQDDDIEFTFNRINGHQPVYRLKVNKASLEELTISIRKPYWAQKMTVKLNKKLVEATENAGAFLIKRIWQAQDQIEINLDYRVQLITWDRKTISLDKAEGKLQNMALQYGPYLLSIDDGLMPLFMAEPSTGNVLFLSEESINSKKNNISTKILNNTCIADGYISLNYRHDGFYGENKVTMRPLAEVSHQRLVNVRVWFNIEKK
jgi:DUF1680 family protein